MNKISKSFYLVSSMILVVTLGCSSRSKAPEIGLPDAALEVDRQSEISRLQTEHQSVLDKVQGEQLDMAARAAQLEASIALLTEELKNNTQATAEQKAAMTAQLEALTQEKALIDAKLKALADEQAALEKELNELKAANEALKKEVEANKAAASAPQAETAQQTEDRIQAQKYALMNNGNCLTIGGGSLADGAQAFSYKCHYGNQQIFKFELVATATARLIAQHSKKCVDVQGESRADQANIHQWTCQRGADKSELWEFVDIVGDNFKLRNGLSGKCIRVGTEARLVQVACDTIQSNFSLLVIK